MTIQAAFFMTVVGNKVRLFVNGTAFAPNWCAEFSDWQMEHITIESIESEDGKNWPITMFSPSQIDEIKRGMLIAARRKSAMNPKLAANIRSLLNLPAFDAKPNYI